jgi:DNA polymerase III subunit delta'
VLYSVERVHADLRRPMSYHPVEGRYRIAIVTDADALRVEAANAFLKLLEEPAERTVFVLTTERADRLLPTITSRCQRLRFDPLPDEAVGAALTARGVAEGPDADALARMAGGSLTRALALASQDDLAARRDLALRFLRYAYAPRSAGTGLVDEVAGLGREALKGVFEMLLRWIQDLARYRAQAETARLINADHAATVAAFCRNVPRADLAAMADLVEEARGLVDRNVHAGLVVRVLADRLGRAMHEGRHTAVFVPLSEAG